MLSEVSNRPPGCFIIGAVFRKMAERKRGLSVSYRVSSNKAYVFPLPAPPPKNATSAEQVRNSSCLGCGLSVSVCIFNDVGWGHSHHRRPIAALLRGQIDRDG